MACVRPSLSIGVSVPPCLVNSIPLALSAFLTLAYQQTDKLMTTGILGAEGTGYLTVAFVVNFGVIELFSTTVLVAAFSAAFPVILARVRIHCLASCSKS